MGVLSYGVEVRISPALSCSRGGAGWWLGGSRLGLCAQCPHSQAAPTPKHLGKPQPESRTSNCTPRRREAPDLEEGEGHLSHQRSLETWGCHSSQELTPVTLMRSFSASYIPAVIIVLCTVVGSGGWAHPHGAVFLELVPSVSSYEPVPAGGGWAGPAGPWGPFSEFSAPKR